MKTLMIAAACLTMMTGAAFAQAGTPQGDSINPHPSPSASSNDKSRNPAAVTTGSYNQAQGVAHAKKLKKKK